MRRCIRGAAVTLVVAAALAVPASPASAVCMEVHVEELGCVNPCYPTYAAYDSADQALKDRLPDHVFDCLH